jgi:hypothetical protein
MVSTSWWSLSIGSSATVLVGQAWRGDGQCGGRHRAPVFIPFGTGGGWLAADLGLAVIACGWTGIGDSHGYLAGHDLVVTVCGRGLRPGRLRSAASPGRRGQKVQATDLLMAEAGTLLLAVVDPGGLGIQV